MINPFCDLPRVCQEYDLLKPRQGRSGAALRRAELRAYKHALHLVGVLYAQNSMTEWSVLVATNPYSTES
jgi:hypothetical protein